ncbi:hypothetical protein FRB95_000817 [Tulasnella sp. JGI-2019a]|nr:hypothetical protein FRB95_000817 [Tulasnella sp. JGI-2019a]
MNSERTTSSPSTASNPTNPSNPSSSTSPQPDNASVANATQSPAPTSSSIPDKAQLDQEAKIRNAAAQARHRQKRKAHIAQMEQTLAQLQERLRSSNGDARLRQLQQENDRLHREIQQLRAALLTSGSSDDGHSSPPMPGSQGASWVPSQNASSHTSGLYSTTPSSSHYANRSSYFPQASASDYHPSARFNPMAPWPMNRSQYASTDYGVAMPDDFEDFEEDTTAAGLVGWSPSQPQ